MSETASCDRKGRWIRGCRFEPRYDLWPADFSGFTSIKSANSGFAESLRKKIYRGDICVVCGKIVNCPSPPSKEGE